MTTLRRGGRQHRRSVVTVGPQRAGLLSRQNGSIALPAASGLPDPESPAGKRLNTLDRNGVECGTRVLYVVEALAVAERLAIDRIVDDFGAEARDLLPGIIRSLCVCIGLVAATTATGAAGGALVGSLALGVGAIPGGVIGASLGFEAGLAVLDVLGLAFLAHYAVDATSKFAHAFKSIQTGIEKAWGATDALVPERETDLAAQDIASGLVEAFAVFVTAASLYLIAKGVSTAGARLPELTRQLRSSRLGEGFAAWVERNQGRPVRKSNPEGQPISSGNASASQSGAATIERSAESASVTDGKSEEAARRALQVAREAEGLAERARRLPSDKQQKILYGERVPNEKSPGGTSNRVVGGHSAGIKNSPDFVIDVVQKNTDGTTVVKFRKKFPNGQMSKPKKSTLAPDDWPDQKVLDVTQSVADSPPVSTRSTDGATLHRQTVEGVQWEVVRDRDGIVTSSYPTGGTPTESF